MAPRWRKTVAVLSVFGALVLLPSSGFAAGDRTISISIRMLGVPCLAGSGRAKESQPAAEFWDYLASTPLKPVEGFQVNPLPSDPLKATLRGPMIIIDVEPGGKAEVKELRLVRRAADAGWTVDPADVERIAKEIGRGGDPGVKSPLALPPRLWHHLGGFDDGLLPGRSMYGTWRAISYLENGKKTPEEQLEKSPRLLIYDGEVMVQRERGVIQARNTMDPDKEPKQADVAFTRGEWQGQTAAGIYQFDGESIKLCYSPPGKGRPAEFSSGPGSRHVLVVYQRQPRQEPRSALEALKEQKALEARKQKEDRAFPDWAIWLGLVALVLGFVVGIINGRSEPG